MAERTALPQITLGLGEAGTTMTVVKAEGSVGGYRDGVNGEFNDAVPQGLCHLMLEIVMTPLAMM